MRKQKDFKPDKEGAGLLARLYITQKQRRSVYKWSLYAFLLLVLSVLQDVVLCRVRIFGATTDLVPCAIILICVLEGGEGGAVFALISSLLYVYSGTAPGPYCMVFLVLFALGISIFRQAYLQSGFGEMMEQFGDLYGNIETHILSPFLRFRELRRSSIYSDSPETRSDRWK